MGTGQTAEELRWKTDLIATVIPRRLEFESGRKGFNTALKKREQKSHCKKEIIKFIVREAQFFPNRFFIVPNGASHC